MAKSSYSFAKRQREIAKKKKKEEKRLRKQGGSAAADQDSGPTPIATNPAPAAQEAQETPATEPAPATDTTPAE